MTNQEPDFIAQTSEVQDVDERSQWFIKMADEFSGKGATCGRCSSHPDNEFLCLVEGWIVQPEDQGPVRWNLTQTLNKQGENT